MDAITLLKTDHDRVKKMLAEGETTTERGVKTRTELLQTLKLEMVKVMKENIEHHIEEEEGEMFKNARQVFERKELEDLGARMTELKEAALQFERA